MKKNTVLFLSLVTLAFHAAHGAEAEAKKVDQIRDALKKEIGCGATHDMSGAETQEGLSLGLPAKFSVKQVAGTCDDAQKSVRHTKIENLQKLKFNAILSSKDASAIITSAPLPEDKSKLADPCAFELGKGATNGSISATFEDELKYTIHGLALSEALKEGVLDVIVNITGKYDEKKTPMELTAGEKSTIRFLESKDGNPVRDCTVEVVADTGSAAPAPAPGGAPAPADGKKPAAEAAKVEETKATPKANKGCQAGGDGGPSLLIFGALTGLLALRKRARYPLAIRS